jgi:multicomponent Na+:H+ antiporter subunit F
MNTQIPALGQAYHIVFLAALFILIVFVVLCLLRAVLGPTVADRIVAINMCGTMVMVIIGVLALMMNEGYLVDICMIYAMISFLAVIVITKIYMGVHLQKQEEAAKNPAVSKKGDEKTNPGEET